MLAQISRKPATAHFFKLNKYDQKIIIERLRFIFEISVADRELKFKLFSALMSLKQAIQSDLFVKKYCEFLTLVSDDEKLFNKIAPHLVRLASVAE